MIKKQKQIIIKNNCGCIVDNNLLINAILWFSNKPVFSVKNIFIHSKYPAISIYDKKIHIHRLLMMYKLNSDIENGFYVHHKDGNKLNNNIENLELIDSGIHQSLHNKNKILSKSHRKKISEANKRRKGVKIKKRVEMPGLKELIIKGYSINAIAKYYGCDWSTVKNRLHENPELLEGKCTH